MRRRSGRFDWTVQVQVPPPLVESGARRRAQEKATRMTMEFLKKKKLQKQSSEARRSWDWTLTPDWG